MDVYGAVSEQVLEKARALGLLKGNELTMIPETVGVLTEVTQAIADDMIEFHQSRGVNVQVPIWQGAMFYAWTKGVESAYLFHDAPKEPISINYRSEDLFQGLVGAQVPRWLQSYINTMAPVVFAVLADMLPWMQEHISELNSEDDWLRACLCSSLFYIALIGVNCGQRCIQREVRSESHDVF